jgi:kynureninase
MKRILAATAAVIALGLAGAAGAVEVANSSANSAVASGSGSLTLGPGASVAVTGATNTSSSAAVANAGFFGPTSTVTATNSHGATFDTHAQTGFTIGGSTAQQSGNAHAGAFAFSPF